jgi:hypothetical protein
LGDDSACAEESFRHVRDTLIRCKEHGRDNVSETASSDFLTETWRQYIRDVLDPRERLKTIKFSDNHSTAETAFNFAIGALLVQTPSFTAPAEWAAFTPKVFVKVAGAADPRISAAVRLEALL